AMSKPIPAVAYYRMSSNNQDDSIPQQQAEMRPKCKLADIQIEREFEDWGKRGGQMKKRDAFQEMLRFCQDRYSEGKPIEAIVCWDASRFSRATSVETNHYIWEFQQVGVHRLFTASGKWIDFRREDDRLLFNVQQDFTSHRYVVDLSANITRGKKENFE